MAHSDTVLEAADSHSFDSLDDAAAALADNLDGTLTGEDGEIVDEAEEPKNELPVDGDAEQSEEPKTEEQEDESDEQETAIDAPASLTADEKETFTQLPQEAQQYVKDFAIRRDQEVQQGLEKARSAQQTATSEAAEQTAVAKQQAAESIYQLAQAYEPQAPNPQHYGNDVQAYNSAKFQYDQQKAQHDQVVQSAVAQYQQATSDQQAVDQQFIVQRDKELMTIPEVANVETRGAYLDSIFETAEILGYDREFLAQNGTSGDIKAMAQAVAWKAKADKWDGLQSSKMKGVRAAKTAKPNATQSKRSGKQGAFSKSRQTLRQSGTIQDAAAAISALE